MIEAGPGEAEARAPAVDRFALLAAAVAGRKIAVAEADSERSYTDGERIFVGDREDGRRATRWWCRRRCSRRAAWSRSWSRAPPAAGLCATAT